MRIPPVVAEVGLTKRVELKDKPGKFVVFGQFRLMGMTLEFPIPEELVPDAIEGRSVELLLDLSSGKWNRPNVRLLGFRTL